MNKYEKKEKHQQLVILPDLYNKNPVSEKNNLGKCNYCNLNMILITIIYFIVKSDKCTI